MNRSAYQTPLLMTLLLLGGATAGYWLATQSHSASAPTPTSTPTQAERQPLYWYDPMYPQQHFPAPGKSPFMDMQLVPRYAEQDADNTAAAADSATSASLHIAPSIQQNLGVRLATVTRGPLVQSLQASAVLAFNERDVALLQARAAGFVERTYAHAPGDLVVAGAPLAELLIPEWAAAQEEFLALRRLAEPELLAAARQRLRLLGMPAQQIAQIERSGRVQALTRLSAPIAGVIQELNVRPGMTLAAGEPVARINGLSRVWLELALPEAQAGALQLGQKAEARLPAFPGEVLTGTVASVLPAADAQSRTLRVRVELANPDGRLRPGMSAQVRLHLPNSTPVLLVPSEAVIRTGKRARETIAAVKNKLEELRKSLPAGVELVTTYDRSQLIERAVANLSHKLIEEFVVVALVCLLFLGHLRSSLVAIVALPVGVLLAFSVMRYQGINANIMSLGGIAIAIGAMVDAAVVMIENAHKRIEAWHAKHPGRALQGETRWQVLTDAAVEVGPALFFSLLIITLSFIPVFTLQAQEGRLFGPLAFTKTYAMAAAAGLSVTLVPVLMGYWIRGRIPDELRNPLNRGLIRLYRPALEAVLRYPKACLLLALLVFLTTLWPLARLGGEFLPALDEGDLLYMPSALPGLSAQKAAQLLQQTDRLIKSIPEVAHMFGKAGRAESATDPAPLEMFETSIQFKPKEQWRAGLTTEQLIEELDRTVKVPGLTNIWIAPIRNRIDMLATGIKSPIGVKVAGGSLAEIDRVTQEVKQAAKTVPGVSSALAERLTGGRYIDVDIDRQAAARFGLNISDVQAIVASAIGGQNIGETVEGLARYPINLRYPREWRDSLTALTQLPIYTAQDQQITLGMLAKVRVNAGPAMLKNENARPSGWVYIDVRGRDLAAVVADLRLAVDKSVTLAPGMSLGYSGQFEFLERANARLKLVVPATLLIIFVLLYLTFGRFDEALLIMATLPFALTGGVWLLYLMGFNLSVATGVGFIALAGVAAEFGVIMLLYLKNAWTEKQDAGDSSPMALRCAIREGAVQRVRPKAMTVAVAVIIAGLLPILWSGGTGSEVMSRIAVPMIGGMLSAPLLSLLVIPAAYWLMRRRQLALA